MPDRVRLTGIAQALDPVHLLRQIERLQNALWQHAMTQLPESGPEIMNAVSGNAPTVRFTLDLSTTNETTARGESEGGRKYRRTKGVKSLRLYRTRPDPFVTVWEEIEQELMAHPERTAKAVFQDLQERHPGAFPENQPRTLQRRVQAWRMRAPGIRRPVAWGRRARHAVLATALTSDDGASSK